MPSLPNINTRTSAALAVRAYLNLPLSRLTSPELELPSVPMDKYHQFIRYRSSCGEAVIAVTLQREWFPSWYKSLLTWHPCMLDRRFDLLHMIWNAQNRPISDPKSSTLRSPPRYLWNCSHRSALVLTCHPSVEAVTAEDFLLKDIDYPACMRVTTSRNARIQSQL